MQKLILLLLVTGSLFATGQELYVFTEPASNIPAHSVSARLTGHFVPNDKIYGRTAQRYMPELMFGFSKKIMVHVSATLSNMHTDDFKFESYSLYAKYRFYSKDDIHKHFRMAIFADASKTNAPFHYDEISLMGDKSGIQLGLVLTQLKNRFALNGTVGHTQVFDRSRNSEVIYVPPRNYQSVDYSLSAGYLLFPRNYVDYDQTNINLYLELLGQQILDHKQHYLDLGPAVQFIFNSNLKLNLGYRFQLSSDMQRMNDHSWQISIERIFLNALKKS
jgi:hypothetical protein